MTHHERRTCLDGGPIHAYESTGLHDWNGSLVTTRRCVWCDQEQTKPYGAGSRRSWTTVKKEES